MFFHFLLNDDNNQSIYNNELLNNFKKIRNIVYGKLPISNATSSEAKPSGYPIAFPISSITALF